MTFSETQRGMTAISIAFLIALAGFGVFLIFKLAPPYIEAYNVQDALHSLKKDLDIREKSKDEVYSMLKKRFDVNDIKSVGRENITIKKSGALLNIQVNYEARVPLFGNIDLAMTFNNSVNF